MAESTANFEPYSTQASLSNRIKKRLKAFVSGNFKLINADAIGRGNWMALIALPDGSLQRFRCTDGLIVDEKTVGD